MFNSFQSFSEKFRKKTYLFLNVVVYSFILLFAPTVYSQNTGQLYGTITSENSGEVLIGINIVITDTKLGAATDLEGKYVIHNIPSGYYSIKISGIGFATNIINEVKISGNEKTPLNVMLREESYKFDEVVITGDKIHSTDAALLSERKKSLEISDQISSEQIKRTPDATSGDALKRITGINVVDNKFVYIRGISDRYNETMLDGSSVTSTEAGKKSFSFDLLPSNLLEFTSVIKSSSPDLPGNFTGGLVQLHTLDFPNDRIIKLSYGTSANSNTSFKNFFSSQSNSGDWLGFDNGSRKYPGDNKDINQLGKLASNNWAPRSSIAPLNNSFSLVYADKLDFSKEEDYRDQFGYVLALTYRNTYQRNDKVINDIVNSRYNNGSNDQFSVLWGSLANFSLKLNGLHKISFKNNFNQSGEDAVSHFDSKDFNTYLNNQYTVIDWTQRSVYNGQISGEHTFPSLDNLNFQWKAGVSSSKREDPDRKEVTYYRSLDDDVSPFTAAINQRSWSKMNDRTFTYGLDFVLPVLAGKLKIGSLYETRETDYRIRFFNIVPDYQGGISDSLTQLPLDQIYASGNYGSGKFLINESSKATDSYKGNQQSLGAYFMADLPFTLLEQNFRIAGGIRLENSLQNVSVPKSFDPNGPSTTTQLKNIDYLPSFNFVYIFNEITNLRLSYSQSINRPDFRELASTGFYDFIKYEFVGGNPDLKRALIKNFDVRFEIFPGAGEVFAVSFFKKSISNAIEERLFQSSVRTRSWFNSDNADNYGWEFELRKSLAFIHPLLNNLSVMANYTRVNSKVSVTDTRGNSTSTETFTYTRPLQGQSPYTINLSLWYSNPVWGTTLNVMFNKFGRRLDAVGFQSADIYEESRDMVDFAISQDISKNIDLKFTVRNLTNKDRVLTQDNLLYERTESGKTYSLQFGLKL